MRGFFYLYLLITSITIPVLQIGGSMTYELFKASLLEELKGHFPPDTAITVQSIPRNNQPRLEGLTILEKGLNIAPTIYIQTYYEKMESQKWDFSQAYRHILEDYYAYRPQESIDVSFFQEFSHVQDRIMFQLIHAERNQELLKQIPHIPFLDLAIVFYCLIFSEPAKSATILIQNSHLKLWGIDVPKLRELAGKNTPEWMEASCEPLSRLLSGFPLEGQPLCPSPLPIYVLTNRQRFHGAACLLYQDFIFQLSKKFRSDFYIIPSSIHEVLLIPATSEMEPAMFNQMIREVNETQLEPDEILSDHVYYYDRSKRELSF